jgi:16S rRNA processing protein RimM
LNRDSNKLVRLGYLLKPHGLKGELKVVFFNEDSRSLKNNQIIFLNDGKDDVFKKKIENVIYQLKNDIIKFFEIDTRDDAEKLSSLFLEISRKDLPKLKDGEFYLNDLIEFNIYDKSRNKYGVVINIFQFPANNVLVVLYDNKEQLIPIIDDVVLDIKHNKKEIIINPIPGLFNL